MLINFFHGLKEAGIPVTTRELLDLMEGIKRHVVFSDMDDFYYFSRTCMVKDEKYFDRFDRAFGAHFKDLEGLDDIIEALIPDDWLRSEFMKNLTDEEKEKIESLGGLEKLIEEFKNRLEEQKERHEGGDKWVGTGGTSPFGQEGYHPEGIRVAPMAAIKKQSKSGISAILRILMTVFSSEHVISKWRCGACVSLRVPVLRMSSTWMTLLAVPLAMLGCLILKWCPNDTMQ